MEAEIYTHPRRLLERALAKAQAHLKDAEGNAASTRETLAEWEAGIEKTKTQISGLEAVLASGKLDEEA